MEVFSQREGDFVEESFFLLFYCEYIYISKAVLLSSVKKISFPPWLKTGFLHEKKMQIKQRRGIICINYDGNLIQNKELLVLSKRWFVMN